MTDYDITDESALVADNGTEFHVTNIMQREGRPDDIKLRICPPDEDRDLDQIYKTREVLDASIDSGKLELIDKADSEYLAQFPSRQ